MVIRAGGRPLSRRQREVFHLLLTGSTNREISTALGIRDETVKTYVSQVLAAFDVTDRVKLVSITLSRTNAILKDLADRIDLPLVVSDEAGAIWLANETALRFGLASELLPIDLRSAIRLRHTRGGIAFRRGTAFESHGSGLHLRWIVENSWVLCSTAMLLWSVSPFPG